MSVAENFSVAFLCCNMPERYSAMPGVSYDTAMYLLRLSQDSANRLLRGSCGAVDKAVGVHLRRRGRSRRSLTGRKYSGLASGNRRCT